MIKKTGCVSVSDGGVLGIGFEYSGLSENGSHDMDILMWARDRIELEIANKKSKKDALYVVSSDMAKLKIAWGAIDDATPERWTGLPTYKLENITSNALANLSLLITEAERIAMELSDEVA